LPDIGFGLVVPTRKVKLLAPSGHTWASGSPQTIQWGAPDTAVTFKVKYSSNGGAWKQISCTGCHGDLGPITNQSNGSHQWNVPVPAGNLIRNCLIRIEGYDSKNNLLSFDKSHAPFTIEVVRLTDPDGGGNLTSGASYTVAWTTNTTIRDVYSATILYTLDGGTTWTQAGKAPSNPGTYNWTVPHVNKVKTKCKVRVVLKDKNGIPVGSDGSNAFFTIQP
jgi:hypothetical protein